MTSEGEPTRGILQPIAVGIFVMLYVMLLLGMSRMAPYHRMTVPRSDSPHWMWSRWFQWAVAIATFMAAAVSTYYLQDTLTVQRILIWHRGLAIGIAMALAAMLLWMWWCAAINWLPWWHWQNWINGVVLSLMAGAFSWVVVMPGCKPDDSE